MKFALLDTNVPEEAASLLERLLRHKHIAFGHLHPQQLQRSIRAHLAISK